MSVRYSAQEAVTEYRINLTDVRSYEDFVAAFSEGIIDAVGGHWNGNSLDAFHDYLSWPEAESYRLVLVGWPRCEPVLAEIDWPQLGPLSNVIREIFADNPHVTVCFA